MSRNKSLRKKLKLIFKLLVILVVLMLLTGAAIFAYFAKDLPDPEKLANISLSQATKIYDRTGQVILYDIYGEEKRTSIPLDEIPQHVIDATLAIEDERFYDHFGVDIKAIIRAAIADIRNKKLSQGASTITQQVIKISFLSPEKTWPRKIKEAILAVGTELKYSKEEILEMYMNLVSYGSNAYGIEAAANTFFNKSVRELSLAESALLAALLKAPSYYSPYGLHFNELENRKNSLLDKMVELKFISQQEAEKAKQEKLTFNKQRQAINAPHFVFYIRDYLNEKYDEDFVQQAGLKVITTLDWRLQEMAEEIIRTGAEANEENIGAKNASLIALNPKNGHILAMVGSRDYFNDEIDGNVNVTLRPRSPGSAIKPIVYATVFKKGFSDKTVVFDVPTDFPVEVPGEKPYQPQNYDDKFIGPLTIRQALAESRNVPSVKLLYLAGVDEAIETAKDLGISTLQDRSRYYLSFTLGGLEVNALELATAYGAFAQDGVLHKTAAVLRVEDAQGKILEEYRDESKRVLESQITRMVTDILIDNEARIPVFGAASPLYFEDRPVAAKTGTSQDYYDAWTIGYTPSLVTAVWGGNNNNDVFLANSASGAYVAAPMWHEFMAQALADTPIENFNKPNPQDLPEKTMLNGRWQAPDGQVHSILYYVDPTDPLSPNLPNIKNEEQFLSWEAAVQNWLINQGQNNLNLLPSQIISSPININFVSPVENQIIPGNSIAVWAEVNSPSKIRQVDFFFDDIPVGTIFGAPFHLTFRIPHYETYSPGNYFLKIRVYDEASNIRELQRNIILE
jgi:1A family penicillin-binding protein